VRPPPSPPPQHTHKHVPPPLYPHHSRKPYSPQALVHLMLANDMTYKCLSPPPRPAPTYPAPPRPIPPRPAPLLASTHIYAPSSRGVSSIIVNLHPCSVMVVHSVS
jgi:hypothetical protein